MQMVLGAAFTGLHLYLMTICWCPNKELVTCYHAFPLCPCGVWSLSALVISQRTGSNHTKHSFVWQICLSAAWFTFSVHSVLQDTNNQETVKKNKTKGHSFKMNTSTFGQINSCTNFKFSRFVIYITSPSLHHDAEHKGCESFLFCSLYLYLVLCQKNRVCLWPSMCLIVYIPFNRKKQQTFSQDVQCTFSPECKSLLYI